MKNALFLASIFCLTILMGACSPGEDVPPNPPSIEGSNLAGQAFGDGGTGVATTMQAAFSVTPTPAVLAPTASSTQVTIGTEDQFVWNTAYVRFGDKGSNPTGFIPVTLTGTAVSGTGWLRNSGTATYTVSRANAIRDGNHVAFVASCRREGGTWNCNNGWQWREIQITVEVACAAPSCLDGTTCLANNAWRDATSPWQCSSGTMVNRQTACTTCWDSTARQCIANNAWRDATSSEQCSGTSFVNRETACATANGCWTSSTRECTTNGAIANGQLCDNTVFVPLPEGPTTPSDPSEGTTPGTPPGECTPGMRGCEELAT